MRVEPISIVEMNRLSGFGPGRPRQESPQRRPQQPQAPERAAGSDSLTLSLAGIAALIDDFVSKNPPSPDNETLFYAGVRRDLPKLAAAGIAGLALDRDRPIVAQVAERLAALPDAPAGADPQASRIGPDHPLFQPQKAPLLVSVESARLQAETRLHQLGAGPAPHRPASPAARAAAAAYGAVLRDLGELAGLPGAGVPPLPQERAMEVHALKSLVENLALLSGAGIGQLKVAEGTAVAEAAARRAGTLAPVPGGMRPVTPAR